MRISNYDGKANQFLIEGDGWRALQSYKSLVAVYYVGRWYFGEHHDYSVTTSRHVKSFCGYNSEERRKMLNEGTASSLFALPDDIRYILLDAKR